MLPQIAFPPDLAPFVPVAFRDRRIVRARAAIALAPHIVAVVSADGIMLDIEQSVYQGLGYRPTDLIGHSAFDFLDPVDHHVLASELTRPDGDPTSFSWTIESRVVDATGTWCPVDLMSANRIDDPTVGGIVVAIHLRNGASMANRVAASTDFIYRSLETMSSDGTTIFDPSGKRIFSSPSLLALLGYSAEEFAEIPPAGLVHPQDIDIWKGTTKESLRVQGSSVRCEMRLRRADGRWLWVETTTMNLLHDPSVRGVVAQIRDIDERRRAQEDLRRLALTDDLTGLGNRAAMMRHLADLVQQPGPVSLLFCDLDGFKAVNDQFGHDAGDQLLVEVGRAISKVLPNAAFAARVGGDEFCVIVPLDDVATRVLGDLIRVAICSIEIPDPQGYASLTIDVSIGLSHGEGGATSGSALLSSADHAMYEAKRENRISAQTRQHPSRSQGVE